MKKKGKKKLMTYEMNNYNLTSTEKYGLKNNIHKKEVEGVVL